MKTNHQMKQLFLLLVLLLSINITAQETLPSAEIKTLDGTSTSLQEEEKKVEKENRLSAYGEVTAYNFNQYNYTLDVNYRITDRTSLSSWNTITSGRTAEQGFDYNVVSALINFKSKDYEKTLSFGYSRNELMSYDVIQNFFVVKLRVRLF